MKNLKILDYLIWAFVLAAIVSAVYFYQVLPEQVATHWNSKGEVDGWGSKAMGAWLSPVLMVFMYFLFKYLPKLDPKKENYKKFAKEYRYLQLLLIGFFTLVHFATNLENLNYNISVSTLLPAGIGIMFIFIGFIIKGIKPNWFVGIRTPWTLSSDYVWKKTHVYGSKAFILSGVLFLVTPILPIAYQAYVIWLMFAFILSIIIYSYIIFKNQSEATQVEEPQNTETE